MKTNKKIEDFKGKNVYIFGFGVAGKWLRDYLGDDVKGFIDNNLKKNKSTYQDTVVYSPDQAKEIINPDDVIIISVLDIVDIIPVLNKKLPNINWFALGIYLNSQKVLGNLTGESDEYLEYTLKAVEACHKSYLSEDRRFIHSVDVVISEKCTLNCVDCSNLMQYYEEPKNLSYELIVDDFESLTRTINHIYEIRLIGGEPFANKDIYRIIDYFLANQKISKLVIYTNATIPLKENLMSKYSDPKIVFSITDYGDLSKNTKKVTDVLDNSNIAYRALPPNNWTDSAKIFDHNRSEESMIEIFENCCGKNLFTLMYGKLYRCPFSSNAERLNAIPQVSENSVKVDSSLDEIEYFLNDIPYIPACNFCNGRSHNAPEIIPAIQSKDKLPYKKYFPIAKDQT